MHDISIPQILVLETGKLSHTFWTIVLGFRSSGATKNLIIDQRLADQDRQNRALSFELPKCKDKKTPEANTPGAKLNT